MNMLGYVLEVGAIYRDDSTTSGATAYRIHARHMRSNSWVKRVLLCREIKKAIWVNKQDGENKTNVSVLIHFWHGAFIEVLSESIQLSGSLLTLP